MSQADPFTLLLDRYTPIFAVQTHIDGGVHRRVMP